MAEVIRMPKMSDTMEEGIIATWLKQEGDIVKIGDILAEVETDKATMELEAYEEGTLLYVGVKEKEAAPINTVIAIIGEPDEDITSLLKESSHSEKKREEQPAELSLATPLETSKMTAAGTVPSPSSPTRILASPLAKKMAKARGYDLANMQGTGVGKRIIKRDVEGFSAATPSQESLPALPLPAVVGKEYHEDIPISTMRKTIAKRLVESKFSAPHFYLTINVVMDQVVAARPSINEYAPIKISFNDIIIKAASMAIRQHPAVNTAWLQDKIRYNKHIHMGVAVAIEAGLMVPVLRFVDNKSLAAIALEVKMLRQKVLEQRLRPQDLEGSTFTISNLGMLGIESFTAIVNPPAACILAVGEVKQIPIVKEGTVVPGYAMKATLSCDHRVVDGAVGAAFLQTFKQLLEDPRKMLVH